jgi:hypothetical protein
MEYKELIATQKKQFSEGLKRIEENKSQWDDLTSRISEVFQILVKESKEQMLFENLHIFNSSGYSEYSSSMNIIQLSWGQHPTGVVKTEMDQESNKKQKKIVVEKGGALVFSQDARGEVAVLIYPMVSDVYKRREENIISDKYSSPSDITNDKIMRAVNDFFAYSQFSSLFGSPSYLNWIRVQWLIFRDIRNREKNSIFFIKHGYELVRTLIPLLVGIVIGVFTIK